MANRVTSITEQKFSAKRTTMANALDQAINNLVDTEIDKLCDEGVPDISATHVADRVRQTLWKIDQLVNEGVLDSNATPLGQVLGHLDGSTLRAIGAQKDGSGMWHLRGVAAELMARRFDPEGSSPMRFYHEFEEAPDGEEGE
jgi:hypothetical protein